MASTVRFRYLYRRFGGLTFLLPGQLESGLHVADVTETPAEPAHDADDAAPFVIAADRREEGRWAVNLNFKFGWFPGCRASSKRLWSTSGHDATNMPLAAFVFGTGPGRRASRRLSPSSRCQPEWRGLNPGPACHGEATPRPRSAEAHPRINIRAGQPARSSPPSSSTPALDLRVRVRLLLRR